MKFRSLGDMLRHQCKALPDRVAMMHPEGGGFAKVTYAELWDRVGRYATVAEKLGLGSGDRVALQSENGIEWALFDWACRCLNVVVVPIYPTLPADQSQFIAKDCAAKLVISGNEEQATKFEGTGLPVALLKAEVAESAKGAAPHEGLDPLIDEATLDSLCTIIYTSGTTGNPKGAMLTHGNFLHVCHHAQVDLPLWNDDDTFLTFLPMSHVYERVAGQTLPLYLGVTIGYSKGLASLASDIEKVKPSIMLCVPRFLEATMDKILDGTKKLPPLRQKLFAMLLDQGAKRQDGKFAPFYGLLDKIVGAKLRARFGGRMRYFVSGGAALPGHVAKFYGSFGLTVLQGWGLTETTGGTTINHPARNKYWTVGETLGMEIKIAEDGEILVRGPGLMKGYYNLPEETAKAIDADGWFATGDIGEFEGKSLKITDRKKDLIVLANGKNVAPQPIENRFRESAYISEIVLFGDGSEYIYGLVVPNFERLEAEMRTGQTPEVMAENPELKARIKAEIDRVNKTLADFEKVKKHALMTHAFTIDSGELTPSLKVKRKVVRDRYADLLATLRR